MAHGGLGWCLLPGRAAVHTLLLANEGGGPRMAKRLTRAKAIRLKCLDCCCNNSAEVRLCNIKDCSLWRYRMGTEERDDLYYQTFEQPKTSGSEQK